MIKKESAANNDLICVTFELPASVWAGRINLVGEFNDWDTTGRPLCRHRADANWRATVELEAGRRYRFRYLLGGKEWLNNWHADGYLGNSHGSYDSVVDLTDLSGSPPLAAAQALRKAAGEMPGMARSTSDRSANGP